MSPTLRVLVVLPGSTLVLLDRAVAVSIVVRGRLAGCGIVDMERGVPDDDGSERWLEVIGTVFRSRDGSFDRRAGTPADVTSRRAAVLSAPYWSANSARCAGLTGVDMRGAVSASVLRFVHALVSTRQHHVGVGCVSGLHVADADAGRHVDLFVSQE